MSVVLLCPSCQRATPLFRAPVPTECSYCNAPFPPSARDVASAALSTEATPRPLLVTLGAGFCCLWAGTALLILLIAVLGSGPYRVNGVEVSKAQFLTSPELLWVPIAAIYCGLVAYFVFAERPSARPAMLVPWIAGVVAYAFIGEDAASRLIGILWSVIAGAIAWWYLYGKPNVVAYFERLEATERVPQEAL